MSTNEKLAPGKTLGRYELLLPIAQGGMATVWAARQKGSRGFQKTVAVKTMLDSLSEDPQFEQMFLDEAALAAKIHHPNVAEILDLGEEEDVLYIVMEWIDGEALSTVTKQAKKNNVTIQNHIALKVVSQACLGLHAAHELKDEDTAESLQLVHRDVSPQNILVTYDGIVKLVDFGVAKAMGRAGGETTAGQLKGKVPYMSPEQAKGGMIDRRTDIFAMGIVLYKMTTGLHPFLGDNDLETMKRIIGRPVLAPRMKFPKFPLELEQVIMKCLQKQPDNRYQTMLELHQAIERVQIAMGASVVDDDVGSFVRSILGDRGQKRRLALRDAVRSLDERASLPGGAAGPQPVRHEAVSDIIPTRMQSGMQSAVPDDFLRATGQHSSLSQIPAVLPSQQDMPTNVAIPVRRSRPTGMIVAIFATMIAVAAVVFFLARVKSGKELPPQPAGLAGPPRTADAHVPTAATSVAPPPTTEATGAAPPAPSADPVASATSDKKNPGGKKQGGNTPAPTSTASASSGKTTPVTGTQYVPSIHTAGF